MLSDPAVWGPLVVLIAVVWAAFSITRNQHVAAVERREDHREMMEVFEEIREELARIELLVGGIDKTLDPPPTEY